MEAHFSHNVLVGFLDFVPSEPLTSQVWRPEEIALVYIREATSLPHPSSATRSQGGLQCRRIGSRRGSSSVAPRRSTRLEDVTDLFFISLNPEASAMRGTNDY